MILAVDIGGTKTLVAVLNQEKQILTSVKFPTPEDYSEFLNELAKAKDQLSDTDFEAGAIGVRGVIDRQNGLLVADSLLSWRNVPVRDDCESIFGCKILLENDSKLAGLSEARSVPDKKQVVYITISTGIGSTLVIDGALDLSTIDSEVGKWIFEKDGKYQTWESYASGKAMYDRHGKFASELEIGDPIWEEVAENLALGMVNICASYTPDVIIVGGGVGGHLEKFQTLLQDNMQELAHPIVKVSPLQIAVEPDFAVIYGCYYYALSHTD